MMRPISAMNVIPFIDVMLVLLAIVLTTATFVAQGRIPVNLPSSGHADAMESVEPVEVSVQADGALYVDDQAQSLDDFAATLQRFAPETRFVLKVDEQAAFTHFVAVIDRLKAAGLANVSIVTRQAAP